jgi:hypothetical protein
MNLIVLANKYSIYRFNTDSTLPDWIYQSDFYSVTRTNEEISVVALQSDLNSKEIVCNRDWRILKISGPLDFALIGIIADIAHIFKKKKISIFTISTYNTDYFLVKQKDLKIGIEALSKNGYTISLE